MRTIRSWAIRIASVFSKARSERELTDELDSHLELHIKDNLRRGMTTEAARRDALIKLGGIEQTKERYRQRHGISGLESLAQDLRYATRVLRKNPVFTVTAVLTLALGIGANSAIFSFVNGILLRPLPYRDSERIVQLKGHDRAKGVDFDAVSFPNYRDWAEGGSVFEQMAAFRYALLNLTGVDEPQTLLGLRASAELLPMLGIKPILGRVFVAEEDEPGRDHVVVLSYDLWSSVFGQSRDAIGKSLMLDGRPAFVTLAVKTVTVHTVTYFQVGLLAFTVLDYRRWFAEPHLKAVMRQTDDPWVMAGPLFQPVRGLLFALAFYPLRAVLFDRKDGWLVIWLELVILGILSPFGASPGSVEGMIYTIWPLGSHLMGLPEVFLQSFLLSVVLHYWVRHPDQKWLNWTLGILLFLVLLPALGLLTRQAQGDQRQAVDHPGSTAKAGGHLE